MTDDVQVQDLAAREAAAKAADYEHGWSAEIDTEFAPKGLSEETVRFISAKKNEPEWMLDWRLKAFRLSRPPVAISLADIVEAIEGPIAMSACVESGKHDCCIEETCRVKPHMGAVNGAVRGALAGVSLASLSGNA